MFGISKDEWAIGLLVAALGFLVWFIPCQTAFLPMLKAAM